MDFGNRKNELDIYIKQLNLKYCRFYNFSFSTCICSNSNSLVFVNIHCYCKLNLFFKLHVQTQNYDPFSVGDKISSFNTLTFFLSKADQHLYENINKSKFTKADSLEKFLLTIHDKM